MTLDEFIAKYNGKPIDFDKTYGAQCFDLYRQYCQEVLNVPQSPPTGDQGAKRIWDTYLQEYFEKISNSPDNFPLKGDIVIWGDSYGPYGHVAVCTEATANTFKCFSQNDPSGALCVIKLYKNYSVVLGWIRRKSQDYRGYDLANIESMKICVDDHIKVVEGQLVDKSQYETIKAKFTESQKQLEEVKFDLATANSTVKSLTDKVESQTSIIAEYNKEDAVQIKSLREAQEKAGAYSDKYFMFLRAVRDGLKLSSTVDDTTTAENEAYEAFSKLNQTITSYEYKVKDLEKKLNVALTHSKPIDKLTAKEVLFLLVEKLFGKE